MYSPEDLAAAIANTMDGAGYGISEQFHNALEAELAAAHEVDQEEGNFTSLDTFFGALEYAASRVSISHNSRM